MKGKFGVLPPFEVTLSILYSDTQHQFQDPLKRLYTPKPVAPLEGAFGVACLDDSSRGN